MSSLFCLFVFSRRAIDVAVTKNTVVIKLDIRLDADKRTVSAILFDNGYTVRKATIKAGNRNKTVLEAYKEEESGKSKEE